MLSRRKFLHLTTAAAACGGFGAVASPALPPLTKPIPASGAQLPVIGMGSWLTFDCADDPHALRIRVEVLREFFARGGALIDSSPMYGTSQQAIGHCLNALEQPAGLFSATKVWTRGRWLAERQINNAERLWKIAKFDLMQVHNLVDVATHLELLQAMKSDGRLKYIGVTTSHGRRHRELETLMQNEAIDFVQLTYNLVDRDVEARLLPLALERGIAVIANRPLRGSLLFDLVRDKPLPPWAREFDCESWASYFLKYVVSHPAVTCAIPATSRPDHMAQNMGAIGGKLPDAAMRQRMSRYYADLA